MHLPNSTHPWPTLHPPWNPGLPQWEDHRQPRTSGIGRGSGPWTRWRVLLRQMRPWHVMCSGLNHWIRGLEVNAFNTVPNKWLWQWRWVEERIVTIKMFKRLFEGYVSVCLFLIPGIIPEMRSYMHKFEYPQDSPPQDCLPRGQSWGGESWYPGISRLPTPIICCFLCS